MCEQESNDQKMVDIFSENNIWVARHQNFPDVTGAGETPEEAVFELMSLLENLKAGLDDEVC